MKVQTNTNAGKRLLSSGYTLLEMCFVLLIVGILTVAFVQVYSVYKKQKDYIETSEKVESAVSKIQAFRQTYGFYPCPSSLIAARNDATYGVPSDCTNVTPAPIANGTCLNGVCIRTTARDLNADGDNTDAGETIRVRYGAIPFRTLQMDEKDTFDAYGSRLSYALTESMGVQGGLDETRGGINVVNELNNPLTNPPGSGSFIILSHGENKIGAITALSAVQSVGCPLPNAAAMLANPRPDGWNCINPAAPNPAATFVSSFVTEGQGASNFDDQVQFFATADNKLWKRVDLAANSEDIVSIPTGDIGMGRFSTLIPPTTDLTIDQSTVNPATGLMRTKNSTNPVVADPPFQTGSLRIMGANSINPTQGICTQDGTKCFKLHDLTDFPSTTAQLACPAGQYLVGYTSNGTRMTGICNPIAFQCPMGQSVVGWENGTQGKPRCSVPAAACPAESKPICGANQALTLLATEANGVTKTITGGTCATKSYTCTNGNWVLTGPNTDNAAHCNNLPQAAQACGAGFAGFFNANTCSGTGSNFDTNCACVGIPDNTTAVACPAGFPGNGTKTCRSTCVANALVETCDPIAGCACDKVAGYEFRDCQTPGYQRKAAPNPAALPWPADQRKGEYRQRNVNPAPNTCEYTYPNGAGFDASNCECDGQPVFEDLSQTPSQYPAVNADYVLNEHCYQPKTGTRMVNKGAAGNVAVPYGYAVFKTPRTAACALDVGNKSMESPAEFEPAPHKWRQTGPLMHTLDARPATAREMDTGCSCQQFANAGANSTCYKPVGGNLFEIYNCRCQR